MTVFTFPNGSTQESIMADIPRRNPRELGEYKWAPHSLHSSYFLMKNIIHTHTHTCLEKIYIYSYVYLLFPYLLSLYLLFSMKKSKVNILPRPIILLQQLLIYGPSSYPLTYPWIILKQSQTSQESQISFYSCIFLNVSLKINSYIKTYIDRYRYILVDILSS